jgi:hypothetical protein
VTRGRKEHVATRLWDRVDTTGECWEWQGALYPAGYGIIGLDGGSHATHRLSWEIVNGPIPDGLFVCHKCDNRKCVRPDHLFLGTQKDNMRDMIAKGRHPLHAKTHCPQGHEYTPENTYRNGNHRFCRECGRASTRAYLAKKREKVSL